MERFCKKFQSLIAITEEVAESYMRRYRIKRPDVIQNLINIDDILFKSNAILPMTMRGEKKLLYCGRMSHDKGLDRLIAVLGRIKKLGVKGWHLTIVGDGDERSENDELVKSNDLSSDVTFVGMVENPYPYMRAADLLICPSRSEGLGLVLWESLICGTSVLATDCGGTRSALRNGEWGRLVNNDEDSLFEGLMEWYGGADFAPNVDFNLVVQDLRNMNEDSEKRLLKVLK
jgi:glycosyltransferase involved in cell wall biosynthesis